MIDFIKRISIFFSLIISGSSIGYSQRSLTLKVVDSLRHPLKFCSVTWNKASGNVTDSMGVVVIDNIASIADSIVITTMGYHGKKLLFSEVSNKQFVEVILQEKFTILPDVYVGKKKERAEFGVGDKREGYSYITNINSSTLQAALLFENNDEFRFLEGVSIFISKKSNDKIPFRIRIFSVRNNMPAEDLTSTDVVIHSYKTGEWNTIGIDSLGIVVPENGFFVGIEWLATIHHKGYNLGVGQTESMKGFKTYVRWGNTPWRLLNLPSPGNKETNIMCRAILSR